MRSILSATLFSLVFLAAPAVSAKQPASGAPAARASAATPEGAQPSTKAFDVEDPMLAPVESPPHVLSSFKEALTRISSRDVDLKTALAEIEKAKGERRQTLAAALPQITATGSVTVELIRGKVTERDPVSGRTSTIKDPPSPVAAAAFTITQPILAPRAWYAIGTADRTIDLARISSTDTRRQLVSNVADAIVAVMTAERIAEINRAELRSALGRLGLEKRGATLGVSANIDLVRFEQDATAARQTLVDGDEQLREARERLGVALGSTEAFGVPPGIKLDDIETSAEKTCKRGKLLKPARIFKTIIAGIKPVSTSNKTPRRTARGNALGVESSSTSTNDSGRDPARRSLTDSRL